MRSPLGTLARALENKAPAYVGRGSVGQPRYRAGGTESQMRAMGVVGTLFSIVDRNASSTAAVTWHLYRKVAPGQRPEDREEVFRHAALDLWNRPNPFFTQGLFIETVQQPYELVGEGTMIVSRNPSFRSLPLELWPVRPDRLHPVPSADTYLAGWIYVAPDGERIPLRTDEVIQIRRPNPVDAYRGIGAVQTIQAELDGVRLSAEWNRNFFLNSAEPGGIVEIERRLSDDEFDELRARWQEQHQGTANAHRVAILEQGKWIDRKYTKRDMEFATSREVSSKVIREAFGMPAFALGEVQDINRATAEAADAWYAKQITVPRLERIKDALNAQLLPMFGTTASGLEFDYDSPVPADREAADRERESQARAAAALIEAGGYGPEVLAAMGLPEIAFGEPGADRDRELLIRLVTRAPLLAPTILPMLGFQLPPPPAPAQAAPSTRARVDVPVLAGVRADLPALTAAASRDGLAGVREDLEEALDRLIVDWEPILMAQIDDLVKQVEGAVDNSAVEGLAALSAGSDDSVELLRVALGGMAQAAAERMAGECRAQGVDVSAPRVDEALTAVLPGRLTAFGAELADIAVTVAQFLAGDLAASAGREALRLFTPGADGSQVAVQVRSFLGGLKGSLRRSQLGAALHRATNVGRGATLKAALKVRPGARILAIEENDDNTCKPCKNLDGYQFEDLAEADAIYGPGGYYACDGRDRCRGTYKAVWD